MPPDDRIRLRHMLDAAREALSFIAGRNRSDLDPDRLLAMALVKEVEIIGEAAYRMADDTRAGIPSIPWSVVIGMRHRLVHAYFDINLDILWDTVTHNLSPLIAALEAVLADEE